MDVRELEVLEQEARIAELTKLKKEHELSLASENQKAIENYHSVLDELEIEKEIAESGKTREQILQAKYERNWTVFLTKGKG